MDVETARWLVSDAAGPALAAASAEPDPDSLAAATRLRALVPPDQAAAALTQAALRRRAVAKFGPRADRLFLTPDGLEQATRHSVAARRAARFAQLLDPESGQTVVDLGCGIGADALAFLDAGLSVDAVERDEATATLAAANVEAVGQESPEEAHESRAGVTAVVRIGDAETLWPRLATPGRGVFADPARRTATGRSWRVEDLSPPWSFVESLVDGSRVACVKLGPGVPHAVIPEEVEAEWVSDAGSVVECALWAGPGTHPGRRTAVVDGAELASSGRRGPAAVGPIEAFLYEPDGAVVRAGLVDEFAALVRAHRLHEHVAYLSAPWHMPTPFATAFAVREVLPFDEKALRAWVRRRGVGTLEIKKRGLEVDPAELRRRLRPKGKEQATLVLTPTSSGAVAVVCDRVRS